MKAAAKYVLPGVVGAMTGMILISLGEKLLQLKYPLPPDAGDSKAALANAIASMPKDAFEFLLVNYAVASLGAGIAASLVAKRATMIPAIIVGVIITLGGIFNNISIPGQPQWFSTTSLFVYLPFSVLGYLIVKKRER